MDNETGLPVAVSYYIPGSDMKEIPCTSLVLAAGPWTALVYESLFPKSKLKIPISNIAGWSIVFRDPTIRTTSNITATSTTPCHAVLTTSTAENFLPELFSRTSPATVSGDAGREIYLAGLNSSDIPLPIVANEVDPAPDLHDPQIASLLRVAKRIILSSSIANNTANKSATNNNDSSLEVLCTGLCHRPITPSRRPIITRINPQHYAHAATGRASKLQPYADSEDSRQGGLYVCAGHGPWGISLSLGTGKVCADLIIGNAETPVYLSALGL